MYTFWEGHVSVCAWGVWMFVQCALYVRLMVYVCVYGARVCAGIVCIYYKCHVCMYLCGGWCV